MRGNRTENPENTRMELKYCEHCGGLWFRASGDGEVYCEECKEKIEQLPAPKKKPQRIMLPVQSNSLVDEYRAEDWEVDDLECRAAAGGVA